MKLLRLARSICAFTLFSAYLAAQTVSSALVGTVLDPASAVVPNAAITVTDQQTGSVRTGVTDSSGVFRFLDLQPDPYTVSVKVTGFKAISLSNVMVGANETRDVGKMVLELGSATETISVMAEATPIQLASSEKSQIRMTPPAFARPFCVHSIGPASIVRSWNTFPSSTFGSAGRPCWLRRARSATRHPRHKVPPIVGCNAEHRPPMNAL